MQGANPSAKLDVFKKLKPYLASSLERKFIEKQTIDVTVVVNGKSKKKKEEVINLTDEGRKFLEASAGPEAQAAGTFAQAHELQQELKADRKALVAEVQAILTGKSKGPDPAKEIKALAGKLDDLAKHFAKLESSLQSAGSNDVIARIDQAFMKLEQKLQSRLALSTTSPAPLSNLNSGTASLHSLLRTAYEQLCLYSEFEDGLVPIPRLYHEARRTTPNLTVHAFHQELEALWSKRVLELKVLNEVRSASEPDKAIRRGDNLYYYVYWAQP